MPFPALEQYLARLYSTTHADTRVWVDADGRAQGRYFNSTLTSAFQSIRVFNTTKQWNSIVCAACSMQSIFSGSHPLVQAD